jgi:hypothetical protein
VDNGSRVNREVYARFCERLGVKSPGPTYLFTAASRTVRRNRRAVVCLSERLRTLWPAKSCSSTIYSTSKAAARLRSKSYMLADAAPGTAEDRCLPHGSRTQRSDDCRALFISRPRSRNLRASLKAKQHINSARIQSGRARPTIRRDVVGVLLLSLNSASSVRR